MIRRVLLATLGLWVLAGCSKDETAPSVAPPEVPPAAVSRTPPDKRSVPLSTSVVMSTPTLAAFVPPWIVS